MSTASPLGTTPGPRRLLPSRRSFFSKAPGSSIGTRSKPAAERENSSTAGFKARSTRRQSGLQVALLILLPALPLRSALAQWEIEDSRSTASLRGIISVGGGVAWASGTQGTVLRTEDGGYVWQGCVAPPNSGGLDFRAVQAWDENTAIVMSSGPGDLSRIYKTVDGCRSWRLLLTNKDKTGFWDALIFTDRDHGTLLGDPVNGRFVLMTTADGGTTWTSAADNSITSVSGESIFAASNSSLLVTAPGSRAFCTGGPAGARVIQQSVGPRSAGKRAGEFPFGHTDSAEELIEPEKTSTSGCFSVASKGDSDNTLVGVGGDYAHPESGASTAWTTAIDNDEANQGHPLFRFAPARSGPAGYRSAVAYDPPSRSWVAVGPEGTDISRDDGQNWHPLKPAAREPADTDKHWNAVSLPFAVGPKGRIGKLRADALTRH